MSERRIRKRKIAKPLITPKGRLTKESRRIIEAAKAAASTMKNKLFAEMYIYAIEKHIYEKNDDFLEFLKQLREPPVSIETFLDSPEFLGGTDVDYWPEARKAIININKDWWKGKGKCYTEFLGMQASGNGKCVTGGTEFLTPNGWKRIDEYEEGDLVGQYHEDRTVTFVRPQAYVAQRNTSGFYKINNRNVDMEVTPKHRLPYITSASGNLKVTTAEEVVQSHNNHKYGWKGGSFITQFHVQHDSSLLLEEAEIRLMVAVMADGSFRCDYVDDCHNELFCTVRVKKKRKVNRIIWLLQECGVPFRQYHKSDGFVVFTFEAPQYNKTYNGWWGASYEQLLTIKDEVLRWDGSTDLQRFWTCDKNTADFIQYVGVATGTRTSLRVTDRVGEARGGYTVQFWGSNYVGLASNSKQDIEKIEAPDGMEYCFKVPTGLFVSRLNDKVNVTGNTFISIITILYHLHILGCMREPQKYWGLTKTTSIVFVIQAAKPHVTKKIVYLPMRKLVEDMPWFQRHMRPHKLIESEMYFEDFNIRVVPGGSDSDAVLGEAIMGAIIDEINFMAIVEQSKKAGVGTGRSASYDVAENIYGAITRRKKRSFPLKGPSIGVICTISQNKFKGDFTDRLKDQVESLGHTHVYVYAKTQYEGQPPERHSKERFRLLLSDNAAADVRILKDDEKVLGGNVIEVPLDYKEEFEKDSVGSLREIVGLSVGGINPFFRQQSKIMYCVQKGEEAGLRSFLHKDNIVLGFESLPLPFKGHYCTNPSKPRYVHIDLSNTGCRCGVVMVRHDGIEWVSRTGDVTEALPIVSVELAMTLEPDHGNEVDVGEVRAWVKVLRANYGYPIVAVTYDGWQSLESRQIWKKQGMKTGVLSVDRTPVPYKQLRDGIYDGRILMFNQPVLIQELFELEYDEKQDKILKPVNGSKDCADALCGAYNTLLSRTASWQMPDGGDDRSISERDEYERPE